VTPIGKHEAEPCVAVNVGVLQLSVIVGVAHCAIAQESAVVKIKFVGQLAITGFTVSPLQRSVTVTVNSQVETLFLASLAV
jgi:hypothetical protein